MRIGNFKIIGPRIKSKLQEINNQTNIPKDCMRKVAIIPAK